MSEKVKKRGKENKKYLSDTFMSQFSFRIFNHAKHNAFLVHLSGFFLHSNNIFPGLDDLSLSLSIALCQMMELQVSSDTAM